MHMCNLLLKNNIATACLIHFNLFYAIIWHETKKTKQKKTACNSYEKSISTNPYIIYNI